MKCIRLFGCICLLSTIFVGQRTGGKAVIGGKSVMGGGVGGGNTSSHGRSFDGSTQALNSSATVDLTSTKIVSISFWLNQTSFNNSDLGLLAESSANYSSNNGAFLIDPNSGASSAFDFNVDTVSANFLCNIVRPSATAWHHYLVTWNIGVNPNTCVVAVDGSNVTATTGGTTNITSGSFGNYTIYLMSRTASTLFNAGSLADFAIWKADESAQASTLFGGTLPSAIDSGNLVRYAHFCGTASPEPDTISGSWTLTATPPQVAGPVPILNCP